MHEVHQVASEGQQDMKPKEQGHQRRVKNGCYRYLEARQHKIILLCYLNHLKKEQRVFNSRQTPRTQISQAFIPRRQYFIIKGNYSAIINKLI